MKLKRALIIVFVAITAVVGTIIVVSLKKDNSSPAAVTSTDAPSTTMSNVMYSASPAVISKSEMVYVNLSSSGEAVKTTVSDTINTDIPECVVSDVSSLTDIHPISSAVYREINGTNINWHMNSTELIYNGTSLKQLPVSFAITYTLNGKAATAEEIKGQSGLVTINIKLTNNEARSVVVNGKSVTVYSPFVVAGGMILDTGSYTNVAIDSGKVISDSTKNAVVMVGFPGLNASLSLGTLGIEGINFAEEFNISMQTTDFDAGNFYFAAIPLSAIDIDFAMPDTISNAVDGISKLTLIESTLASIDIESLMNVFSTESSDKFNSMILAVNDAMQLYEDNEALLELLNKYMTEENITQFKDFYAAMEEADLANNIALIKSMSSLLGVADLVTEYEKIQPLLEALSEDLNDPEVQAALEKLPETLETLNSLMIMLDENAETIAALSEFMNSESYDSLMQLMQIYSVNKDMFSALSSSAGALEEIAPYLETWFGLTDDYKIFSEAAPGMDTDVMFICKTNALAVE